MIDLRRTAMISGLGIVAVVLGWATEQTGSGSASGAGQPASGGEPPGIPSLIENLQLIENLATAFETRDGDLLREVHKNPFGEPNLLIGDWGDCGGGGVSAPLDDENVQAILGGEQLSIISISKRDICDGLNTVYGVVTQGWQGKTLPHTTGHDQSDVSEMTFQSDLALLVFWTPSRADSMPQPAFFGLAPTGPFESVASWPPVVGDVNCSDVVDPIDAALILQFGAALLKSMPCELQASVTSDNQVNALDAVLVLQHAAGLIDIAR